eukprot:Sspe_Gene.1715::Locus_570_Transcript_2_3_Confidence_0.333_Length_2050::g.1715::m.1715
MTDSPMDVDNLNPPVVDLDSRPLPQPQDTLDPKPVLNSEQDVHKSHPSPACIEVAIRVRPESAFELSSPEHHNIIRIQDEVIFIQPDGEDTRARTGQKRRRPLQYIFDRVYPPEATQLDVFQHSIEKLLPPLFDGYNASVFCYGATGAGKTFTMMGDETGSRPGIVPLAVSPSLQPI